MQEAEVRLADCKNNVRGLFNTFDGIFLDKRGCDACGAGGARLVCPCRTVRYCSKECQIKVYKEHKKKCTFIASTSGGAGGSSSGGAGGPAQAGVMVPHTTYEEVREETRRGTETLISIKRIPKTVMVPYDRALTLIDQARASLVILEAAGDNAGVCTTCQNIAICYINMGQPAQAIPLYEKARASFEKAGDRANVGAACFNIALSYFNMGQFACALPLSEQGRAILESAGDQNGIGTVCQSMTLIIGAACYLNMGQPAQALPLYEQARASLEAAGDQNGVGTACLSIAACYGRMGQNDRALPLHEQARASFEKAGNIAGVVTACSNHAACYGSMGQNDRALPLYEQTRAILEAAGDNEVHCISCDGCGQGPIRGARWKCKTCANFDLCDVCHTQFRATGQRHTHGHEFNIKGDQNGVGTACLNIAACYCSMGQNDRALPLYEQARASFEKAGNIAGVSYWVGMAWFDNAACYCSMGQNDRGLPLYEQARASFEAAGDRVGVCKSFHGLACAYAPRDSMLCRDMLLKAKQTGCLNLPPHTLREHMKTDSDLDAVRELEWYKELLHDRQTVVTPTRHTHYPLAGPWVCTLITHYPSSLAGLGPLQFSFSSRSSSSSNLSPRAPAQACYRSWKWRPGAGRG